jgi:hypothetical protein
MSREPFTVQSSPKAVGDMDVVVKAKDGISLRQRFGQLATVALRETSDGNNSSCSPSLLEIAGCQHSIDRVLLGRVDETAGIDDHGVGLAWISYQLEATAIQLRGKLFGIDFVASATQRDKVHRRGLGACRTVAGSPNDGRCGLKHGRPSMTDVEINQGFAVGRSPSAARQEGA